MLRDANACLDLPPAPVMMQKDVLLNVYKALAIYNSGRTDQIHRGTDRNFWMTRVKPLKWGCGDATIYFTCRLPFLFVFITSILFIWFTRMNQSDSKFTLNLQKPSYFQFFTTSFHHSTFSNPRHVHIPAWSIQHFTTPQPHVLLERK